MKKAILAFCIPFLFILSCLNADTGTISYKYILNKYVEESIALSFVDLNGSEISTYAVDSSKTISSPQVQLSIYTNKVNSYNLKLTFSMMTCSEYYGYYDARIYDTLNAEYLDTSFSSAGSTSITFTGDTSSDGNTFITVYYPIAFDFTKYLSDYSSGSYSATITVEVAT